jgi:hypothetical protein
MFFVFSFLKLKNQINQKPYSYPLFIMKVKGENELPLIKL